MRTWAASTVAILFVVAGFIGTARAADDKSMDEQYQALAASRTKAELAVRRLRTFFDDGEQNWRVASQATEAARGRIGDNLRKEIETEQRKPEESRDTQKVETLNDRAHQIELDWNKFGQTDRPAIETRYRSAQQLTQVVAQLYANLANVESMWKDAKLDLTSLQGAFDAITQRANSALEQGQKAYGDLQQAQKTWESMPEVAGAPAAPAKN